MNRAFAMAFVVILSIIGLLLPGASQAHADTSIVVRRGDTLSAIAVRHKTTVAALMRANKIKTAGSIYAGQRLIISDGHTNTDAASDTMADAASQSAATGVLPAGVPKKGKAIFVSVYQQRMYVYNNGKLVYQFVVSTGLPGRNTARGNFRVQSKIGEAWSSLWQLRMPYWMGIYNVGTYENGIHSLPINKRGVKLWAGTLGRPASFGCVILGDKNAATLFNYAPVGTPVIIRN
jgi:lipoprotein-anchoring transpeptidase ErfK/SrfK